VIARIAFHVLPSPRSRGHLVRPLLNTLHWYGVAGLTLARLAVALRRDRLLAATAHAHGSLSRHPARRHAAARAIAISRSVRAAWRPPRNAAISRALDDVFTSVLAGAIGCSCSMCVKERPDGTGRVGKSENTTNFHG
jgi:hypothetical protein